MKYTVEVKAESGEPIETYPDCSKREATQIAKAKTENFQNQVLVSWFRASDGQHGYLNRDGSHAITGEAW